MKEEDGPWVCLPSKHHPKEVYYFNVMTGVSTWEKPENLRESSERPDASASSSNAKSEHAGYVVESLSPKSSPQRPSHDDRTVASEINEKKKSKFCVEENSFRVLKNKHVVRDFPYKINDRSTKSNDHFDSRVSMCNERNTAVVKHCTPSRPPNQDYSRRMENRLHPKVISQPLAINSYHNIKPSLVKTYDSKLSSNVSSDSVVYGSASLRLENLRNKLRNERQEPLAPQSDWHKQQEKGKSTSFFKERNSASVSKHNQSHPYVLHNSSSRTVCASLPSSVSRQFKDNTCRNNIREIGYSVSSVPSKPESINKTTVETLDDKYKKTGFTKEYNHTSSKVVNNIELTESTSAKRFEYMLPSSSYVTKCSSSEVVSYHTRRDRLYNEAVPDSSSKALCNLNRNAILRGPSSVPVSKTNAFIPLEYKNPPLNDPSKKEILVENKLKYVESRKSTSSLHLPKTPATDRLINLRNQLQAKNILGNSYYSQKSNVPVSHGGESWSGHDYSSDKCHNKPANESHTKLPLCSNNDPRDKNSWKWDTQFIVHEYNHKRVDQSSKTAPMFSQLNAVPKNLPLINDVTGSSSERRIGWNGNQETQYYQASGDKVVGSGTKVADMTNTMKNSNLDYKSNVDCSPSTNTPDTSSFEFIKPNQDTLLKLHGGSRKKVQESKGGITKVSRRVQKQIRTVSPMLRKVSRNIAHKKATSEINQRNMFQQRKSSENQTDSDEMMDWEPIEPEKVVMHVEELRKDGCFKTPVNSDLVDLCNMEAPTSSKWFIVLDTNVLLSHLEFLEYLRDIKDYEYGMPILYIPWIVLQELDGLKSSDKNSSLKYYARKAVRFLQDNLSCRHPRIRGQPKIVSEKQDHQADDSILQCSLDLVQKSYNVLLLTNDRNLYNKAVVSGVLCCSAARLHEDLENRRKTSLSHVSNSSEIKNINDKEQEEKINFIFCQIKETVKAILEEVLKTEMILAYDRTWLAIVAKKPPWTMNDVIFCILKHWIAVFGVIFPATARELLEQIQAAFKICYRHSLNDVISLLNTCESLIGLISSLDYKQLTDKTLISLQELRQALEQLNTKSADKPSSTPSVSDRLCQNRCSANNSSSDSDSQSSVSDRSRKQSRSSEVMESESDTGSESGIHTGNANDSDGDCISLVASSFCDNILNKQLSEAAIKEGQETVHNYLNKIWGKVAVFCGMLSDLMGVEPCVPYEPPDPLPSKEMLHQNMLYFVKCVSGLLRCVERILSYPAGEMFENHPAILNFCSFIKDSFPTLSFQETKSLPHYVYIYCTQSDTRQQLENGRKQFEQFEAVLNDAVSFFMKQNNSGATVTPLL